MDGNALTFKALKAQHRKIRDGLPGNISLRIHRALSWLNCAESDEDDPDSKFIFLWISFNAAYAHEISNRWETSERKLLEEFLRIIIDADGNHTIQNIVWNEYPTSIRLLIDNRFLYQQFWDSQNGVINEGLWTTIFDKSKKASNRALGKQDTNKVLSIAFERLYMLRNQLLHGGATWGSSVNRDQVRDATNLMGHIVPVLIHIMLNNQPALTGKPCFPVIL